MLKYRERAAKQLSALALSQKVPGVLIANELNVVVPLILNWVSVSVRALLINIYKVIIYDPYFDSIIVCSLLYTVTVTENISSTINS